MRSASQIKTAVIIAIVLLLGTNIMMHVAEARAKTKYKYPLDYIMGPEMAYFISYFVIFFYGILGAMVHKKNDDEDTQKMIQVVPAVGIMLVIANIVSLGMSAKGKMSTPEGQMIVSAMSIQIVVCLGFAGYIYSGMRN